MVIRTSNYEIQQLIRSSYLSASLYSSIIEMPQYNRHDPVPPDPGVLDFLAASKLSQSNATDSPYSPYHLHAGANSTASLLYSSWLGSATDHKSAGHIFGLQGEFLLHFTSSFRNLIQQPSRYLNSKDSINVLL